MIVAVFEDAVAVYVFNVEMCIKSEPFLVLAFISELSGSGCT